MNTNLGATFEDQSPARVARKTGHQPNTVDILRLAAQGPFDTLKSVREALKSGGFTQRPRDIQAGEFASNGPAWRRWGD